MINVLKTSAVDKSHLEISRDYTYSKNLIILCILLFSDLKLLWAAKILRAQLSNYDSNQG